jgi:GntR family transcriptional regulator/MocR family aminotransferase
VLYVSTFSKILFPSARIGFMAVPPEIGQHVARIKRISSRQNEQILQEAICGWMQSGGFERHLRRMRRLYEERLTAMLASLNRLNQQHGTSVSWIVPDGGMAMWVDFGQDSQVFRNRAAEQSIQLNPEVDYWLRRRKGTHVRMGFSGKTTRENDEALDKLFSLF